MNDKEYNEYMIMFNKLRVEALECKVNIDRLKWWQYKTREAMRVTLECKYNTMSNIIYTLSKKY